MRDSPDCGIAIRRAVPSDALCIAALGMQVFLDTYAVNGIRASLAREAVETLSPDVIAELLVESATTFLVAEMSGHLVAFAQTAAHAGHERVPLTPATELKRLYVQECFTGRGIGKALLGRAEAEARASGAAGIWLTAWSRNTRARSFYTSQGYVELGPTLFTVQGEQHENRLFTKSL
jgi:GNAT superfamily N-acetyltransferase